MSNPALETIRRVPSAIAPVLALILAAPAVGRQDAAEAQEPRALVVDPAPAPAPVFRYRLFTTAAERTPGDAAPIYLRCLAEVNSDAKATIIRSHDAWMAPPIDEFPVAEAGDFVRQWSVRTHLLALAARRSYCDWSYTLPEQREDALEILLPDVQELRSTMVRLLAVKARLAITEGKFDEATDTITTGLAMAVHLADGPFLISDLVGVGSAGGFLNRVEELIARPGAPNLYWALTALPSPLINFRGAFENEQALGEWIVPEIVGLDDLRGEAEWDARLERLHARLVRLHERYAEDGILPKTEMPGDVAGFRAAMLPRADAFFGAIGVEVPAGEAERIVRFVAESYRRARDEAFKATYLPFAEADHFYREATPEAVAGRLPLPLPAMVPWPFGEIIPAIRTAHLSQARLDRRVAALRVVEAIRLHAAENGGALPESLDTISAVPVPADPISGEPFSYRLEGDSALVEAPETPVPVPTPGLPYRITIRK